MKHTAVSVEFLTVLASSGLSTEDATLTPIRCQQQFYISNEPCDNLIFRANGTHLLLGKMDIIS